MECSVDWVTLLRFHSLTEQLTYSFLTHAHGDEATHDFFVHLRLIFNLRRHLVIR